MCYCCGHRSLAPVLALLLAAAPSPASAVQTTPADHAAHHLFILPSFTFEDGTTLPHTVVSYGTYGRLDARKDNVILLPSSYMADHHDNDWLIGPGLALDTTRYFLVATELFGNGHSSSPSNTPEPHHGPRFPRATIRDNVEAVHHLLVDELRVSHLAAVIGFSMGAEQAFQWGVSYPGFSDRIVAMAGTARCWPHGRVRLAAEIAAIESDTAFRGGDYTAPPKQGIHLFGLIWAGWLTSQQWWHDELWKGPTWPPGDSYESVVGYFSDSLFARLDANDLILQAETWQHHDVGATTGFDGSIERLDPGAGALPAQPDRPVLPGLRRPRGGAAHPPCRSRADSLALGPRGRRRRRRGRQAVRQRQDRRIPEEPMT